MRNRTTIDPGRLWFRETVHALYSPGLGRVLLVTFHARGDGRGDSGHDLAVSLNHIGGEPAQSTAGQDQAANNQPLWSPRKLST
jgi:hypothetical protein